MAEVDHFLKITGISGQSQDRTHNDEIEVMSWSWGLTRAGAAGPGGAARMLMAPTKSFASWLGVLLNVANTLVPTSVVSATTGTPRKMYSLRVASARV